MSDSLTTLALLWTLERCDGVAIGLTDHDRDLMVEERLYRAAPGMTPAAIERSDGLDPAVTEASGALSHAAVMEADLLAGRWDGARITVAAVDWAAGGPPTLLSSGTIGEIEIEDGGFTAQLRGPAAALERAVTEETSAACRAMLGDRRCRVAMAGRRRLAHVLAVSGAVVTVDEIEPVADAYGGGRLRWMSGIGCGQGHGVRASDGDTLTLDLPPGFAVAPGTLIEISEGCDKTVATCAARFGNAVNFRGEPYLPGMDLLTRYPGA